MLARIDHAADRLALTRLLGATMRADVDPLNLGIYTSASVLGLSVEHSIHGETTLRRVPACKAASALGDRDHYLGQEPRAVEQRGRYQQYIGRLLPLAGFDHADQRAGRCWRSRRPLPRRRPRVRRRAVDRNADHRWSRADFARDAPGMDWNAFFDAAGLGAAAGGRRVATLGGDGRRGARCLAAARDVEGLSALPRRSTTTPTSCHGHSPRRAAGCTATSALARSAARSAITQSAMADAIGELYAARHFSPAQKARVRGIVANVATAFRGHVAQRRVAVAREPQRSPLAKLDRALRRHRIPGSRGRTGAICASTPPTRSATSQRSRTATRRHALARLGKAYDPHEWALAPQTVGAVLTFQQNAYVFAAALLQPPKYDATASDAATYGAIGAIIGHDMSHFVDVLGADYEPDGRMRRWWTADDSAEFEAAAEPIVRQFSAYQPAARPQRGRTSHANGERRRPRRPHRGVRGPPHRHSACRSRTSTTCVVPTASSSSPSRRRSARR